MPIFLSFSSIFYLAVCTNNTPFKRIKHFLRTPSPPPLLPSWYCYAPDLLGMSEEGGEGKEGRRNGMSVRREVRRGMASE